MTPMRDRHDTGTNVFTSSIEERNKRNRQRRGKNTGCPHHQRTLNHQQKYWILHHLCQPSITSSEPSGLTYIRLCASCPQRANSMLLLKHYKAWDASEAGHFSEQSICSSSSLAQEEQLLSLCFIKNSERGHFEPVCHETTEGMQQQHFLRKVMSSNTVIYLTSLDCCAESNCKQQS